MENTVAQKSKSAAEKPSKRRTTAREELGRKLRDQLAAETGGLSLRLAAGLEEKRLERGMSSAEAARACHLDVETWEGLEDGTVLANLRTLRRVAQGLGVKEPLKLFGSLVKARKR